MQYLNNDEIGNVTVDNQIYKIAIYDSSVKLYQPIFPNQRVNYQIKLKYLIPEMSSGNIPEHLLILNLKYDLLYSSNRLLEIKNSTSNLYTEFCDDVYNTFNIYPKMIYVNIISLEEIKLIYPSTFNILSQLSDYKFILANELPKNNYYILYLNIIDRDNRSFINSYFLTAINGQLINIKSN